MTVKKITMWLAVCSLFATQNAQVRAQFDELSAGHDLQFFSPVDFDFENNPIRKSSGLYFRYDKLSWAMTGDRTEIGDPDVVVLSENIFPDTAVSIGDPVPQYRVNNSIQDAPPEADFAWGERYEFGNFRDGNGWMVGILDGPEVNVSRTYGFEHLTIPGTLPLSDQNNPNFSDASFTFTDGSLAATTTLNALINFPLSGTADLTTTSSGFGSVHVNFATPAGYLQGFRDYNLPFNTDDDNFTTQGPTVGGPGWQIVGMTVENDQITDITVAAGGDGITDNLNGNAIPGFFFILGDPDGDGTFDTIIADGVDFGDLHTFNIAFDTFTVRNTTETQGIELMQTIDLSNGHKLKKNQNNHASIALGVRYLRLQDRFYWEGKGSILGRTLADTKVQNSITGPQIRGMWSTQRGRWNVALDGRCMLGYNVQDLDQTGLIGERATPGALNASASAQPNAVVHGRTENDFSPVVELRAETSYQVTSSIAARLGYTAIYVDNITRSSQVMNWSLPNLGIGEGGQQDIFINGVNFGFDVVY